MDDRFYYDRQALARALREVGVRAGDTVLSHVSVGMLGFPREGRSEQVAWEVLRGAFFAVLGAQGTWVIPTFTYSYTKPGEVYDPERTPSEVGGFSEYFRSLPGAQRSLDPLYSVAALGLRASELIDELPHDCFGEDSIYGRLTRVGGKLCMVGVGFRYATYVHHVEQTVGVPYRYPKHFTGVTQVSGKRRVETWRYNVRALDDPAGAPDLRRLEVDARARRAVRAARVGIGEITCVELRDLYALAAEGIERDPWYLAAGGAEDYAGERNDYTGRVEFSPAGVKPVRPAR